MATSQQPHNGAGGGYKRASRKGAPRKFGCSFPGCDKYYSRAEHLQRHQLNHAPKEIYKCDVLGCEQKFVRSDLLARHKKRHSAHYMPRNRVPSFASPKGSSASPSGLASGAGATTLSPPGLSPPGPRPPLAVPHDAAVLLGPRSTASSHPHPHPHAPPPGAAPLSTSSLSAPSPSAIGHQQPSGWSTTVPDMAAVNLLGHPKAGAAYYHQQQQHHHQQHQHHPHQHHPHHPQHHHQSHHPHHPHHGDPQPLADMAAFGALPFQGTFTNWLFDRQGLYGDFSAASMPFLEGGLESTFNSNIHYDYESLTSSRSQLETPPRLAADSDELIGDERHREIVHWLQIFRQRQPKWEPLLADLVGGSGGGDDWPGLQAEAMHGWLQEYWDSVSPRMPIVHQPTFSCNRCSVFLLLTMLALGAASLRRRRGTTGSDADFADFVVDCVRWEILVQEEASPPVGLWVAQALLLLEFYEKLYSLRRLHERAHIYHTPTLTLLRRGSPLIGRSGSESPPEEQAAASADALHAAGVDARTAWTRWADTEAMHRVVFAAFMMDIIHATMFGHAADMAPHEIRLPLPCDDHLWTAPTPDAARQLESNLRMYGIRPVSFLDGLKKALHGHEVSTLSFGRMIIMSGLLSVGWHISHRETHLEWFDLRDNPVPDPARRGWKELVLAAFDSWKESYDAAQGSAASPAATAAAAAAAASSSSSSSAAAAAAAAASANPELHPPRSAFNGPIQSAAALYHLAHISLHIDIVDCQVYAGAKRLVGRRVSTRDYTNVVSRMDAWSRAPSTRHAVLHAFRLLHRVLVDPSHHHPRHRRRRRHEYDDDDDDDDDSDDGESSSASPFPGAYAVANATVQTYSCRADPDPHRPWIMYYAALAIWSYARALTSSRRDRQHSSGHPSHPHSRSHSHSHSAGTIASAARPSTMATTTTTTTSTTSTITAAKQRQQQQQHPSRHLPVVDYARVAAYLSRVATLSELPEAEAPSLITDGLPDLLDALREVLAESHWELLREADERLRVGKEILLGGC